MATATKKKGTKKVKAPDVQVSFCAFDDPGMYDAKQQGTPTFRVVRDCKLGDWSPLTVEHYAPRGSTPLLDATAKFIFHLDSLRSKDTVTVGLLGDESGSMGHLREAVIDGLNEFVGGLMGVDKVDPESANKVLAVVFTDGLENASHEYTREAVAKLVAEREADGFTFIYLGAKQDAWAAGGFVGMSGGVTGQTVNYRATPAGTRAALRSTSINHGVGFIGENASYLAATAASGTSQRSLAEDGSELAENTGADPTVGAKARSILDAAAKSALVPDPEPEPKRPSGLADAQAEARRVLGGDEDD